MDDLRHAEYYHMQNTFDDLYSRSQSRENFTNLMELVLSRENILLAWKTAEDVMSWWLDEKKQRRVDEDQLTFLDLEESL